MESGGVSLNRSVTAEELISCGTPLFRKKMITIREADTVEKLNRAITDFYRTFGT